jgi:WD40 repeat protein
MSSSLSKSFKNLDDYDDENDTVLIVQQQQDKPFTIPSSTVGDNSSFQNILIQSLINANMNIETANQVVAKLQLTPQTLNLIQKLSLEEFREHISPTISGKITQNMIWQVIQMLSNPANNNEIESSSKQQQQQSSSLSKTRSISGGTTATSITTTTDSELDIHQQQRSPIIMTTSSSFAAKKAWEIPIFDTSKPKYILPGHKYEINHLRFDYNDNILYSSSLDGQVGAWDLNAGNLIQYLPRTTTTTAARAVVANNNNVNTTAIHCLTTSREFIAAGKSNGAITIWSTMSLQISYQCTYHTPHTVYAIEFNTKGDIFASGDENGTLIIAQVVSLLTNTSVVDQWPILYQLSPHSSIISAIAFIPTVLTDTTTTTSTNNSTLIIVSGSWDGSITCTNANNGEIILGPTYSHTNWVNSIRCSSLTCGGNNGIVISCSNDGSINSYNFQGEILNHIEDAHHGFNIWDIDIYESVLASVGGDGYVRLWSLPGFRLISSIESEKDRGMFSVCISSPLTNNSKSLLLAAVGVDRMIKVWGV